MKHFGVGLVCLIALLAGGCASRPGNVVTFMVFGDPAEQAAFHNVADGFHAANPDAQVEIIGAPNSRDFMARLTADFAAGTPPDVFLLNYRRMAQLYNNDALELLGPRFTASEILHAEDYYAVALDAFRNKEGELICLPQNISSQVVYYNKDLFDAAGIPYPGPDWDWEELRQTALTLTVPDTNGDGEPEQYGLGLEPELIRAAPFIWQNGGELVDDLQNPSRLALDTPLAREALTFIIDLSRVDGVVPDRNVEAVQSHEDRFYSGSIAMYVNSRRIVPTMRETAAFAWDVAPLPAGKTKANVLHSDGYCLAAQSEVKDLAWPFIEFAISEQGQRLAVTTGRTVPSHIRVAESDAFLGPNAGPEHARYWLDTVPHLRILPRIENWPTIERAAAIELELAYQDSLSLDMALENIYTIAQRNFVPLE